MENNYSPDESNLKENKKKEKKPVTIKKLILRRILFIIIFLLVSVGVTYYLILNAKTDKDEVIDSEKKTDIVSDSKKEFKSEKTIDLDDLYNVNDLEIKLYKETYQGIKIEYYQIDGLKNNSIQTKINYNLKNDLENAIDEAINTRGVNVDNCWAYSTISSSFANTISIYSYVYSYGDESNNYEKYFMKYVTENYDLTTGNKIKLNDIFIEDEDVPKRILSKIYNDVVSSISEVEYNDSLEGTIENYNDIEEEIFKLIYDYNEENEISFTFDEQRILLLDYSANIMYKDNLDYITIYDKYKTNESIFDGTYSKLKDLPVLIKRQDADYTILEQGDNYYIDISLFLEGGVNNDKVYRTVKNMIDDYVKEIKQEAKSSNKFIIANRAYSIYESGEYDINISEWVPDGDYNLNINSYKFEVTKSLFKSEIYDKIIDIFRTVCIEEMGGAYLYNNLFGSYLMYDEETYEEYLTNLDDEINYNSNIIKIDSDGNILDNIDEELFWEIYD